MQPTLQRSSPLLGELQSAPVLGMRRGDVGSLISREGTGPLRRLLQGHLGLCSAREGEREAVTGSDGMARGRCRAGRGRDLVSVFGAVQARRRGYGAPGVSGVPPLDHSGRGRPRVSGDVAGR